MGGVQEYVSTLLFHPGSFRGKSMTLENYPGHWKGSCSEKSRFTAEQFLYTELPWLLSLNTCNWYNILSFWLSVDIHTESGLVHRLALLLPGLQPSLVCCVLFVFHNNLFFYVCFCKYKNMSSHHNRRSVNRCWTGRLRQPSVSLSRCHICSLSCDSVPNPHHVSRLTLCWPSKSKPCDPELFTCCVISVAFYCTSAVVFTCFI